MSEFQLFLRAGIEYFIDIHSIDHFLFIIILFMTYPIKQWNKIIILITAFTLGHLLIIIYAIIQFRPISLSWIRLLIPFYIIISSALNLLQKSDKFIPWIYKIKYIIATLFGFTHGMEFYTDLNKLGGKETNIIIPMISYNIGIELGQIVLITMNIGMSILVVDLLLVKRREWVVVWTGAAISAGLIWIIEYYTW